MIKKLIALMLAVFCLGWASNAFYASVIAGDASAGVDFPGQKTETLLVLPYAGQTLEKASPFDWISEEKIRVYSDKIVIDLPNAEWATFTDTNSMDPVLDAGTNAIQIVPKSTAEIHVGDIVSYESDYGTIIHRVIDTGFDENGWYAILKGDNNSMPDPGKVRFEQVRRVVVALIY